MPFEQPAFCLHNGQIVLVDPSRPMAGRTDSKLGISISELDDLSFTSSTMSDEASWDGEDDLSSDDMDEDDFSDSEDEEERILAAMLENARGRGGLPRTRSTVSMSAMSMKYAEQRQQQQQQQPQEPVQEQPKVLKAQTAVRLPPKRRAPVPRANSMATFSLKDMVKLEGTSRGGGGLQAIQRVSAQDASAGSPTAIKPDDYLSQMLETKLDRVPYNSLGEYFLKATPEHIAAWDGELLRAIRSHDLPLIQKLHQESGKASLQASNQFGETILHVCVRRGTPDILRFLLSAGQVSPKVHCDYGRTPLHDALWTFNNPHSVQMAAIIMATCPEMLLVMDKRGFTPLDYVPRDRWADCCRFLDRCKPFLARLKNNGHA